MSMEEKLDMILAELKALRQEVIAFSDGTGKSLEGLYRHVTLEVEKVSQKMSLDTLMQAQEKQP
jgi:hypothetical protein